MYFTLAILSALFTSIRSHGGQYEVNYDHQLTVPVLTKTISRTINGAAASAEPVVHSFELEAKTPSERSSSAQLEENALLSPSSSLNPASATTDNTTATSTSLDFSYGYGKSSLNSEDSNSGAYEIGVGLIYTLTALTLLI